MTRRGIDTFRKPITLASKSADIVPAIRRQIHHWHRSYKWWQRASVPRYVDIVGMRTFAGVFPPAPGAARGLMDSLPGLGLQQSGLRIDRQVPGLSEIGRSCRFAASKHRCQSCRRLLRAWQVMTSRRTCLVRAACARRDAHARMSSHEQNWHTDGGLSQPAHLSMMAADPDTRDVLHGGCCAAAPQPSPRASAFLFWPPCSTGPLLRGVPRPQARPCATSRRDQQ